MHQMQIDPRAVAAGLFHPQSQLGEEPRLTDAGIVAMLGAFAHDDDTLSEAREHHRAALARVLATARQGGLDEKDESLLLALFADQADPIVEDDKGRLLAVLCRLVALYVGSGRIGALISDDPTH